MLLMRFSLAHEFESRAVGPLAVTSVPSLGLGDARHLFGLHLVVQEGNDLLFPLDSCACTNILVCMCTMSFPAVFSQWVVGPCLGVWG